MKKTTVFFLIAAMLLACIPFAVSAESELDGKKIIAFGDSLTAGTLWWNNNGLDTYPDILARNFPDSTVINAGKRGDSTYNALLRFDEDVLAEAPDIVIICFGMNDQAWEIENERPIQTLEKYRAQLIHFVTELQKTGADVIFVTPNPVYEEEYEPTATNNYEYGLMDSYCNEMREIALEYGCGLVDINYEIEKRGVSTYVGTDGVHQTVAGHTLYGDCITDYLNAVYNGENKAEMTVVYKTESGEAIGKTEYIGAEGANITLATPSHLGCDALDEDIQTVFKNGEKFEMSFSDELTLSRGADYTTSMPNRNDNYDDDGIRLTDGAKSAPAGNSALYSGWGKTESGTVEITVDLGEAKASNIYRLYSIGNFWGIGAAKSVEISVSDNGSDFVAVKCELSSEKLGNGNIIDGSTSALYLLTATSSTVQNARYVRFTVTPGGSFGHLWCDEIEVVYSAAAKQSIKLGDVNFNGEIEKYDYILVKRAVMKTVTLDDTQLIAADVNKGGEVEKYDYILIKRHVMKTYTIGE